MHSLNLFVFRITVVTNIVAFILLCFPVLGPAYRSFLVVPNVMLTTMMACRVYRHTRLDLAQQSFLFPTTHRGDLAQNIEVALGAQTPLVTLRMSKTPDGNNNRLQSRRNRGYAERQWGILVKVFYPNYGRFGIGDHKTKGSTEITLFELVEFLIVIRCSTARQATVLYTGILPGPGVPQRDRAV
ncbi:hypothetical protein C8J57DRAFT_1710498 [Mycena rebaudengoi]|nr:hypothetical protein C8J57DRAFT_1710498 [Mycena rebaudengoi]